MDAIERALRHYVVITRAHQYGGYNRDYRLAKQALDEYKEQKAALAAASKPSQLRLLDNPKGK
jgi:hypothetical protein